MKFKLFETVICRTPAFSMEADLKENWDRLKHKIKEASPAFYEVIADREASHETDLNNKADFTIWKYFNRAKYRATPFASFAAFTVLPLTWDNKPIIVDDKLSSHHFIDWDEKDTYTTHAKAIFKQATFLHANTTIYYVGNEVRYLRVKAGVFEIASVGNFEQLKVALEHCKTRVSKETIYGLMQSRFQMNETETNKLLYSLIDHQLLLTDLSPNITGEDYFKRLNKKKPSPVTDYIIAERIPVSGGLDNGYLRGLPELVNFLSDILPDRSNNNLDNFRQAFLKKFEHKKIPLSVVMDPEIGIGYGNLEQMTGEDELLNALNAPPPSAPKNTQILPDDLHNFILKRLINGGQIQLNEFTYSKSNSKYSLPNTFNVMFHVWQGHPVIQAAGGCTANALLGRFTLASTAIENYGKQIAATEGEFNPGVTFFDIAYQAEKHIDNVNRRKSLYENELPILTWSCLNEPLSFNDILVSVSGSEIMLRSKKNGKRLVPRLPSAYNYTRSDLAAYRFLCDIQQQNLKTDLTLKLADHFPDLDHYPRVVFKDIVVSPAMWKVPAAHISSKVEITTNAANNLKEWLKKEGINFMFKAGHADNYLCFDPEVEQDMIAFLVYCRQQDNKTIYITEALITKNDSIQDKKGGNYMAQYIVGFKHENTIYNAYQPTLPQTGTQHITEPILLPGSDWLYFEIYCHEARSNALLLNHIDYFLKENKPFLKKWFFIRYNTEQGSHIRLRLHLLQPLQGYELINHLKTLLEPEIYNGIISDFNIKTYYREIDRYGASRIELVEKFFWVDSNYMLSLLKKTQGTGQLYATTLIVLQQLLSVGFDTIDKQLAFAKNMADNFAAEMQMNSSTFKTLNHNFNLLKDDILQKQVSSAVKLAKKQEKMLGKILKKCNNYERSKMIADVIHMHINRLFTSDQRKHEAILYHYLVRLLHIRRAVPSS